VVKRQFPLKAGRPGDPLIDKACELVRRGKSVMRVLREQIKNWNTLDPYTRYLAAKGLRQAVARWEKQRKRPLYRLIEKCSNRLRCHVDSLLNNVIGNSKVAVPS